MSKLRHPNVVQFLGAVVNEGHLAIVSDNIPNGSLYKVLHQSKTTDKPLTSKRRLAMALDISKGMLYLHSFRPPIVHRDLKSANVLVARDASCKVADFGPSKMMAGSQLTATAGTDSPQGSQGLPTGIAGTPHRDRRDSPQGSQGLATGIAGTPHCMAPEVLRAERNMSEKSDVFSSAVVLWEIATGKLPWRDLGHMQILFSVGMRQERLLIPSDVQPEVAELITDCWSEDPSQRPSFKVIIKRLSSLKEIAVSLEPDANDHEEMDEESNYSPPQQPQLPSLPPLQGPGRIGW